MKKIIQYLFVISMIICLMPIRHVDASSGSATFEEIKSEEEIIPGQRYIIVAEYDVEGVQKNFILGSKEGPYSRYGYRDQVEVSKNEDGTITVNSDYALKVRFRKSGAYNRYEFEIDDQYSLYSFCDRYNHNHCEDCYKMNYTKSTTGVRWWQLTYQEETEDWLIASQKTRSGLTFVSLMTHRLQEAGITGFTARVIDTDDIHEIDSVETNIHIYREICKHQETDVTHVHGIEATCTSNGITDYYYCKNCEQYFKDETFTSTYTYSQTFIAALDHDFVDGKCSKCSTLLDADKYEVYRDYESDRITGEKMIIGGKINDKFYMIGNVTKDGKRNAVEVSQDESGKIIATNEAEVFIFNYDGLNSYYLADGGEFIILDGELVSVHPSREMKSLGKLFYTYDYEEFGSISRYNYDIGKTEYIALIDDENGPYFTVAYEESEATQLNVYKAICKHPSMFKQEEVKPTCTEQGIQEYEYCEKCENYYQNGDYLNPINQEDEYLDERDFTALAYGHNFENGSCTRCGMKTPVYVKIQSQAEFDALSDQAMYIFAIEIDGKIYTIKMPTNSPYTIDKDENYIADIFEQDLNDNGHPDGYEIDLDENGVFDYLEDFDEDGYIDEWDRYAVEEYLDAKFYNDLQTKNTVEAIVNADGSLSVEGKNAFEFTVEYIPYGKMDSDRNYAFKIPNYLVSGRVRHFFMNMLGLFPRYFGDVAGEGEIQEYGNWEINFDDGETVMNPWDDTGTEIWLQEGNTGVVYALCTGFDPNPGEELRVRLITHPNGEKEFYFITGNYGNGIELDNELPPLPEGATEIILPIYMYAYEPVYESHEHVYGEWVAVDDTNHAKKCSCEDQIIEAHTFGEGVVVKEATCSAEGELKKQCTTCGHVIIEPIPMKEHSFTHYVSDNNASFIKDGTKTAKCDHCDAKDTIVDIGSKILPGDITGDKTLNSKDRVYLTRHLARWIGYEEVDKKVADVNADGEVNNKDRVYLTRHLARWIGYETLPCDQ